MLLRRSLLAALLLILAWKVAGWWGLDRFLLPALGTPWMTRQEAAEREERDRMERERARVYETIE